MYEAHDPSFILTIDVQTVRAWKCHILTYNTNVPFIRQIEMCTYSISTVTGEHYVTIDIWKNSWCSIKRHNTMSTECYLLQ